ncbi:fimbrial biogenesis chaperone [Rahnella aceris]|uniref:fimbrial biogenesis chaperone n=1 Tax=Rahnella sp. (strain Y9602) TaxID=2703885 RepID=UPI001C265A5A|nr:molecular chaperone [Rahnella aceris]MBU9851472.1 molecular chaperone [Rahnella aceris]
MSFIKRILVPLIFLANSTYALAGVQIGATRVIYEEQKQDATLKIKNPDTSSNYLIQSWVEPLLNKSSASNDVKSAKTVKTKTPFVITPPLFSIASTEENILRIIHNGTALPSDRESIFLLHIKAIPETEKKNTNMMVFSVKSTLKLIYRPEMLSGDKAVRAYKKITFKKQGTQLIATNSTPYYLTFSSLSAEGSDVYIKNNSMLAPHTSESYDLGSHKNASTVSWTTIGDAGEITPAETAKL